MKEKNLNNIMNSNSMNLFTMLCGYFLSVLGIYTIFQILKFENCLVLVQIFAILIPIIIYLINIKNKQSIKKIIIVLSCYLFILLVLPFIFGKTYDLTVDGNSYHKTAIAFIKNGWNPIYESSEKFQQGNDDIIKYSKESRIGLWIDHYPKATWIVAATMYQMTGNIESGKSINIIFCIMLFIIAYNLLQIILSRRYISLIISTLLVANPITLTQMFTYYVDALMGMCFTIELLLLLLINPMEKQNRKVWICLTGICTMFVNLKYTGLLCSGMIAAIFYFYWIINYHKKNDFSRKFGKITLNFIIVFLLAILFVGSNSYVKNVIDHKNPLYPIIGKNKVDIITTMQPKSFGKKNAVEKFMISLFSKTENVTYTMEPTLKLPIRVFSSEIKELILADVRIGGFGPLFALVMIVNIIVFAISCYLFLKNEKENIKYILIPLLSIIITIILIGESWWARYIPQLYLFPIGTIILATYTRKYYKVKMINKLLLYILLSVICLNTLTFSYANKTLLKSFIEINKDLKELKHKKSVELKLGTDGLYGYFYNLKDNNIKYKEVKKIDSKESRYMYSWRLEVRNK